MKLKVVVWGASGHALTVADILRSRDMYDVIGFLDNINKERDGQHFCHARIFGGIHYLKLLKQEGIGHIVIAIGNCSARLRLSNIAIDEGFTLVTAIHPKSVIASDATIGKGTVLAAGAVINPFSRIGDNVVVNTCASVDHECVVEDGVHLSPGVRLAGRVSVGRASWVGIGATVIDGVRIGANSIIGAGAVVLNDIPDNVVAYGVPAKVIRPNI